MKFRSTIVDQGSGVLGTVVVEKNGVMRTRNIPSNPDTAFQQAARAIMTALAVAWRDDLTQPQRDGWNAYALTVTKKDVLGKDKDLSGINMFVAGNAVLNQCTTPTIPDPPVTIGSLALPQVSSVVLDDSANTALVTFVDAIPDDLNVILSLSTSPVSPGRSVFTGPYRKAAVTASTTAGLTILFTGITVPVTGEKFGWQLSAADLEARVSNKQRGLTTVVA